MALFSQNPAPVTPDPEVEAPTPTPAPTPVTPDPARSAAPAPAPTAAAPSIEANAMAYNLAALVVAGGVIGIVLYFTIVPLAELFNFFLTMLLPIAALAMAIGLISAAGFNQFKNGTMISQFLERLKAHRDNLNANPQAARK
jgi:hypothetical protein